MIGWCPMPDEAEQALGPYAEVFGWVCWDCDAGDCFLCDEDPAYCSCDHGASDYLVSVMQ